MWCTSLRCFEQRGSMEQSSCAMIGDQRSAEVYGSVIWPLKVDWGIDDCNAFRRLANSPRPRINHMAQRTNFRADTVGSLLRPAAVHAARADFAAGKIDAVALRKIEDAAIRDVVKLQEDVGLPVVTDGEFRRENWYADFIGKLNGVVIAAGSGGGFAQRAGQPKHVPKRVQTTGKVSA